MSKSSGSIGLIAEDVSDVEALKILLKRITGNNRLAFKHFVGRGCGKVKRKAEAWAVQLKSRGCRVLILLHDLDRNDYKKLHKTIHDNLAPFVIRSTFISIPIEEMEAWFLADGAGVRKALNLKRDISTFHHPQNVNDPKGTLIREIEKASNDSKIYINTKHSALIAKSVDINLLRNKCRSFAELEEFAKREI